MREIISKGRCLTQDTFRQVHFLENFSISFIPEKKLRSLLKSCNRGCTINALMRQFLQLLSMDWSTKLIKSSIQNILAPEIRPSLTE